MGIESGSDHVMARMDAGRASTLFYPWLWPSMQGLSRKGYRIVAKILSKGLKTTVVVQDTTVTSGTTGGDTLFLFAPELLSHTRTRP